MQPGDSPTASRPFTCAGFLDAFATQNSSSVTASHIDNPHRVDREQQLSATLFDDFDARNSLRSTHSFPLASPSPIPASVSEDTNLSSSPAALFLSAFMSPKADPKPAPDEEGYQVGGYTLGPIVGFGTFSTIRRAASTSGGAVAVKIIRRADLVRTGHAPVERKKLEHEAAIWASLSHEHILPLFSTVHTSFADYFITLYCPAGSLYDILKRDGSPALPQDDAGMMFRQVVRGLRYLHEDAVLVHRDVKLENVLVDESGVCRIGDFGLSVKIGQPPEDEEPLWEDDQHQHDAGYNTVHRAFSLSIPKRSGRTGSSLNPVSRHHSARQRSTTSSHTSTVCQPGSLPYAAPEALLPQSIELALPHPSQDIWALGVLLYALLTGYLPFNDSFEPRLQMKILNGAFDVPQDIGRGAERILHGCLERSVPKRWSIAMVDDVAWGVGWGSAGDGATPEEEDDPSFTQSTPDCEPYPVDTIMSDDEDWQHEDAVPRSAMEAATRRSTSRAKRSLSRAPIISRTQSARSRSRQPSATSPPYTGLNTSFLHHSNLESASSSACPSPVRSPLFEISRSRSVSRPRGRRLNKSNRRFPSRSPSPSVVPTTPVDLGSRMFSRMNLEDHPEEFELDPAPRGRSMFASTYKDESDDEYAASEDDKPPHLSPPIIGAIAARWPSSFMLGYRQDESVGSDYSSRDRSIDVDSLNRKAIDEDALPRLSRPGSTPPGPSDSRWDALKAKSVQEGILLSRRQSPDFLMGTLSPGLISRSRSAEEPSRQVISLEMPTSP